MTLDELQQRAADNRLARLAVLLDAIEISAQAEALGPGAKSAVAEHIGYSTRTVSQLAAMHGLPEDCIDLDAKPGMYWAAIQNADVAVDTIRHALAEGWTTAGQVKQYLGVADGRKPPLLVSEVDIVAVERGRLVVRSENIRPEDGWPRRAKVRVSKIEE